MALLNYYQQSEQLDELVELLRKNSEALFKRYQTLEEKYADMTDTNARANQIKSEMGGEIKAKVKAIRTTLLQNIQKRD